MITLGPKKVNVDEEALRVFMKAIEVLGGPRKLIEHRNLTWLPSLMEAAYAVVLKNEHFKTEEEIARELGITKETVRNILSADPEEVLRKLEGEKVDEHTAGGLAKLAYKEIKEGRDTSLMLVASQQTAEALGINWAVAVLEKIKGMDFPVGKEELLNRIGDVEIKGKKFSEIADKLSYPIKNPAELLHEIADAI